MMVGTGAIAAGVEASMASLSSASGGDAEIGTGAGLDVGDGLGNAG